MTDLAYRYDECGLDNVVLEGLAVCNGDEGETVFTIPNINGLHRVLTAAVAAKPTGMTGRELRFVRTELGLTQAELAGIVNKDGQTVGRWERGETPIDPTAETVVRLLALQKVNGEMPPVAEVARLAVASSGDPLFRIDASDPTDYRPIAA